MNSHACAPRGARRRRAVAAAALIWLLLVAPAAAIDDAVPWWGGDASRALLGPGTGVVIGIVDSGIDASHPFLAGTDSLGQAREVARANFVTSEPANLGDDVYGHGTAVASAALGHGAIGSTIYAGPATDARYVNARVLDSNNQFSTSGWVANGVGFAVAQGADVVNLSLGLFSSQSDGQTQLDLLADYLTDALGIFVVVSAGNLGNSQAPHGPGAARNVVTVGALNWNFTRVASFSQGGPTSDGRSKPDVVAPGQLMTLANDDWEVGSSLSVWTGTSFAAPQVAGLAAQMIEYGREHQLSTDPRVIKAVLLTSAVKTLDSDGSAWSSTATQPLDDQQGAGRIDGWRAAELYMAGAHAPGVVPGVGWALEDIVGASDPWSTGDIFTLERSPAVGSYIEISLVWNRHVSMIDLGEIGTIDQNDLFFHDALADPLDNLDLYLFRDGQPVAWSTSLVDSLEHIYFEVDLPGSYDIRVVRAAAPDAGETYALAWHAVLVPEPESLSLALAGMLACLAICHLRVGRARKNWP